MQVSSTLVPRGKFRSVNVTGISLFDLAHHLSTYTLILQGGLDYELFDVESAVLNPATDARDESLVFHYLEKRHSTEFGSKVFDCLREGRKAEVMIDERLAMECSPLEFEDFRKVILRHGF